jgi:hypothetical protein
VHSLIITFSSSGRVRMTSTKHLIDTFQSHIPLCQVQRAFSIERTFRFIWHNTSDGLHPKVIIIRQRFERTIKQIRKSSF